MEIRKENEERIKLDFCQQLLIEKLIRRVEVTDVEKVIIFSSCVISYYSYKY